MTEIARDFDLTESSVRRLARQAEIDAGHSEGLTSTERRGLVRLRISPAWSPCASARGVRDPQTGHGLFARETR